MRSGASSGAGGHVSGEDVVGVPVEILTGVVVAHGGLRVGVPGGDLYVAEVAYTARGSKENPPREIRSLQKFARA